MNILDIFRVGKIKKESEDLSKEIAELKATIEKYGLNDISVAEQQLLAINHQIGMAITDHDTKLSEFSAKEQELQQKLQNIQSEFSAKEQELQKTLRNIQDEIVVTEETALMQSFGLYQPKYEFSKSELYKSKLEAIRLDQREMIKAGIAVTGNTYWTVNNSLSGGKKMVADMQKILLRAFNGECDSLIANVKFNNFETQLKRITASYEAISKLGRIMNVSITSKYYKSKVDELHLALDYQQKKQKEKEEEKEIRAQLREEEKARRELEEARRKTEKEQAHYQNALQRLNEQITTLGELPELLEKRIELTNTLESVEKALAEIDYRQANQKAGYVYIISNIGAFGDNIYKIGMTRRLDPTERVYELGDASVPFNFDTHAMIFSDNAPALEAALHRAFADRKLNWVNTRREFFRVSLDEIKSVVLANHDKTVEFIEVPDAEQYRVSQKLRETGNYTN
jgi:seryl-tRNA synthetase